MRPTPEFNVRKAAQVAAYFACAQGGTIDVLKLVKLLYLADRQFMTDYDEPILWDRPMSMDHGPVNSITYDLIGGVQEEADWDEFVTGRANHKVGVTKICAPEELDELSLAELDCLKAVWAEFGHMTKWAIRDYTHDNCPEWEDPQGSSAPIPYARIFRVLGKDAAGELDARVNEALMVGRHMATL